MDRPPRVGFARIPPCRLCSGPALIGSTSTATSPTNRLIFMSIATICRQSSGSNRRNWRAILGFAQLRALQSLVVQHREEFLEAWNEFFGIGG
jgi:hypothetical protein